MMKRMFGRESTSLGGVIVKISVSSARAVKALHMTKTDVLAKRDSLL
jgi:hypothetical protein